MSRPTGAVPIIATDLDYVAPAKPWDGTPTKTIMSGGEKATGFVPNAPVFPDKLNSLCNDFGQRLSDVDLARVLSWPEPGHDVGSITLGSGSGSGVLGWCPWQQDKRILHAGSDKIRASLDGGYTWADEHDPGSSTFFDVANLDLSSCVPMEISGAGYYSKNGTATGTWGDRSLLNSTKARVIQADPYHHCYVIGGEVTGTHAGLWIVSDVAGEVPATLVTTANPASSNAAIETIAIGPSLNLASYTDSGTGDAVVLGWSYDTIDVVSVPLATGPTIPPVFDLLYLPNEGRFVAVCMTASNTDATIWHSTDGIAWTHITTLTGCRVAKRAATVDGSIVVVPVLRPAVSSSDLYLAVSSDGAVSFDLTPDPVKRHTLTSPSHSTIRKIGNRLGITHYIGGGTIQVAYSFKSGAFERS